MLELLLSTDVLGTVTVAGLRWFACDATPVLPVDDAGRPADTLPRPADPWIAAPVFRPLIFSFLMEGVVLTTEVLLIPEAEVEATFLPAAVLPEETFPDA